MPFLDLLRKPLLECKMPLPVDYAKACVIVTMGVLAAGYALSRLERQLIFHL